MYLVSSLEREFPLTHLTLFTFLGTLGKEVVAIAWVDCFPFLSFLPLLVSRADIMRGRARIYLVRLSCFDSRVLGPS
jgi:hypothetical protein